MPYSINDTLILYLVQTFKKMFVSKEELKNFVPEGGSGGAEKYAVGDIFITTREGNPNSLLGYGTWSQIKDSFLLAAGDTYTAGATGGAAEHTLTVDEMPAHSHGIQLTASAVPSGTSYARISSTGEFSTGRISETGGSQPHNNMPPYLAVYMWIRTS